MFAPRRAHRILERVISVPGQMLASETKSTYLKDIGDHRLAFVCMEYRKASEGIPRNVHSELRDTRRILSGLPSHTPLDRTGGDTAIHMVPYTGDKAPNMACRMCGDYNAVHTPAGISGCMNDRTNKEGRTDVGI